MEKDRSKAASAGAVDSNGVVSSSLEVQKLCREQARRTAEEFFHLLAAASEAEAEEGPTLSQLSELFSAEVTATLRAQADKVGVDFDAERRVAWRLRQEAAAAAAAAEVAANAAGRGTAKDVEKAASAAAEDEEEDDSNSEEERVGGSGKKTKFLRGLKGLAKGGKKRGFGLFHKQHSDEVELSSANNNGEGVEHSGVASSTASSSSAKGARPKVKTAKVLVDVVKDGPAKVMVAEDEDGGGGGGATEASKPKWEKCRMALVRAAGGCMLEFYVPPKVRKKERERDRR